MNESEKINYFISVQADLRGEIKQRISQRDGFSTQFLIACGTVVTISFQNFPFAFFLIWLMPIVTIFYSLQILYSYVMHDNISRFLRKHIEPELSRLLEIKQAHRHNFFWETRCSFDRELTNIKYPGIRKEFFEKVIFIVPVISAAIYAFLCYFRVTDDGEHVYSNTLLIMMMWLGFVMFVIFEAVSTYLFIRFKKKKQLEILGKRGYINKNRSNYLDRAVFLDRDGTIIVDKVQPKNIEDIEFFDDTISALKALQEKGYLLIIITNQDGIKQKKLTQKEFEAFNDELISRLENNNIIIDAIYYSPHEPNEKNDLSFKPMPGMLYLAAEDFRLDLENCYFIGDQYTDYIAGIRAGVKSLYVETGIYKESHKTEREDFFKQYNPKCYKNLTETLDDIKSNIDSISQSH